MREEMTYADFKAWVREIEIHTKDDPQYSLAKSQELLEKDKPEELRLLVNSYASFMIALNKFLLGITAPVFEELTKVVDDLIRTKQYFYAAKAYAVLGMLCAGNNDPIMATDMYLKGMDIAYNEDAKTVYVDLCCNIGVLFLGFHDYKNALSYFENSLSCALEIKQFPERYERRVPPTALATLYLNIANAYYQLGNVEEAEKNISNALNSGDIKSLDQTLYASLNMMKAQIANLAGNEEEYNNAMSECDIDQISLNSFLNAYDDVFWFMDFLLKVGREDDFCKCVSKVEALVDEMDNLQLTRKVLELKIRYYTEKGLKENYYKASAMYFCLSQRIEEELNKVSAETLVTRISLREEKENRIKAEKEAKLLKTRSERDGLTKLYNRYMINDLSEEMFNTCKSDKQFFGIEILDIDFFKQYNDYYGHQGGDDVLIKVADILRNLEEEDEIVAGRFGGDEFLLIFKNKDYEAIKAIQSKLRRVVEEANIAHEKSSVSERVTLSQGAFVAIPAEEDKLFDYLFRADKALYKVKEQGKNGELVVDEY